MREVIADSRFSKRFREVVRNVCCPRESLEGRTDAELGSPHADRYARDENGHIVGVVGFAVDVTERRQAEASLATVMQSVADAIITLDEHAHIKSANPAARIFGHPGTELLGRTIDALLVDLPTLADRSPDVPALLGVGREVLGRRKSGTAFPADLSEFHLDGTRYFMVVVRDITARKQLEEQFRQAQKMEAFGQLAGGIAHDFNNLLTVINGYSALLLTQAPGAEDWQEALTEIREAGTRAARLTAQLLAFSRKSIIEPKVLDLNRVIDAVAKLLRRLLGEDVTLVINRAPNLGHVKADPGQIEQVIMNLAVNARRDAERGAVNHRDGEREPGTGRRPRVSRLYPR